jgi:hypothetical protein
MTWVAKQLQIQETKGAHYKLNSYTTKNENYNVSKEDCLLDVVQIGIN